MSVCVCGMCVLCHMYILYPDFTLPDLTCSLIFQLQLKLTLFENKEGDWCVFGK